MRVLHCLWSAEVGGAQRALYQLISAQHQGGGVTPGLLLARPGGVYHDAVSALGAEVRVLNLARGADPRAVGRGAAAMAGWDVHHFHSMEPALFAASLRRRGTVRAFTARGGAFQERRTFVNRMRHAIGGRMLRAGFHAFSGNTAHAAAVAAARYGLDPRVVRVTSNGIDFSLLEPVRSRDQVRAELGMSAGDFVVGTAAVLKGWKRVERLLEASVALGGDVRARAVVIGGGPERNPLERRAAQLGLGDRVVFTGLLDRVADHVAALDAFVLTSGPQESFGNALIEAMALGVPSVVFADAPGPREHVADGETGLVVADVAGLVAGLRRLAVEPAWAASIGEAGRISVRGRYSLAAMVAAYDALYAEAFDRRDRG